MDTVETFHGGKNPLSNLHNCTHGCTIHDSLHEFHSSEQHYQFQYLHHHGKVDESYTILETASGWEVMKTAHEILLDTESRSDWWDKAVSVMTESNQLKYESCPHA